MVKIAPSVLSADFSRLGEEVRAVEKAGADWIHLDVMDGHFVPNLTIGPGVVKAVRGVTSLPLDVHLMITNPENYLEEFAAAGTDWLTVHQEVQPHLHRTVCRIRELGMKAGVSLNPATSPATLDEVLGDIDLVLVMSVNPGFGGQSFIPSTLEKIRTLKRTIDQRGLSVLINVDGGIKTSNAAPVIEAGADILVSGSGIYGTDDYAATIARLKGA